MELDAEIYMIILDMYLSDLPIMLDELKSVRNNLTIFTGELRLLINCLKYLISLP